ncbi:hypothetical protein ABK040_008915 [Willaertia magna]
MSSTTSTIDPFVEKYREFLSTVISHSEYARALSEITSSSDIDFLAKVLLDIANTTNKSQQLIKELIHFEISKYQHMPTTIFRSNSLASKALGLYVRDVGYQYLKSTIGILCDELIVENKSLEIDPKQIEDEKEPELTLQKNIEKLTEWSSKFLETIMSPEVIAKMPKELRLIAKYIGQVSDSLQLDTPVLIGGYIMLRFFNPAIATPDALNLTTKKKTKLSQRNFILITKVIQNLANNVLFGNKEKFMICMNDFLTQKKDIMREYLMSIIDYTDPLENNSVLTSNNDYTNMSLSNISTGNMTLTQLLAYEKKLELYGKVDPQSFDLSNFDKKELDKFYKLFFEYSHSIVEFFLEEGITKQLKPIGKILSSCLHLIDLIDKLGEPINFNANHHLHRDTTDEEESLLDNVTLQLEKIFNKICNQIWKHSHKIDGSNMESKFFFYKGSNTIINTEEKLSVYYLISSRLKEIDVEKDFGDVLFHIIKVLRPSLEFLKTTIVSSTGNNTTAGTATTANNTNNTGTTTSNNSTPSTPTASVNSGASGSTDNLSAISGSGNNNNTDNESIEYSKKFMLIIDLSFISLTEDQSKNVLGYFLTKLGKLFTLNQQRQLYQLILLHPGPTLSNIQTLIFKNFLKLKVGSIQKKQKDYLKKIILLDDYSKLINYGFKKESEVTIPEVSKLNVAKHYKIIKVNPKGKHQERLLKITMMSLLNIDPKSRAIKNERLLSEIEEISAPPSNLEILMRFRPITVKGGDPIIPFFPENDHLDNDNEEDQDDLKSTSSTSGNDKKKEKKKSKVGLRRYIVNTENERELLLEDIFETVVRSQHCTTFQSFNILRFKSASKKTKRLIKLTSDSILEVSGRTIKYEYPFIGVEYCRFVTEDNEKAMVSVSTDDVVGTGVNGVDIGCKKDDDSESVSSFSTTPEQKNKDILKEKQKDMIAFKMKNEDHELLLVVSAVGDATIDNDTFVCGQEFVRAIEEGMKRCKEIAIQRSLSEQDFALQYLATDNGSTTSNSTASTGPGIDMWQQYQ